ncbi:MAG TPA: hypothetical protein PK530_21305, partial [Anaerolineales bacterium]|nr:hypothetical protein [Anaerolineales bacterium]
MGWDNYIPLLKRGCNLDKMNLELRQDFIIFKEFFPEESCMSYSNDLKQVLRGVMLFAGLSDAELEAVAAICKERKLG